MSARRAVSLVAAIAAATAGLLPIVTATANAAPAVVQAAPSVTTSAAAWDENSPVYKKWKELGGASFTGDLVDQEIVQSDGIRYAKFANNVFITYKPGVGAFWFSGGVADRWWANWRDHEAPSVIKTVATMDQVPANRGSQLGVAAAFDNGSSVYYSDAYGAFSIRGTNRDKYWANGSINGRFGWLLSEEQYGDAGSEQKFSEAVSLYKKNEGLPFWISGALRDKFLADGGAGSSGFGWLWRDQIAEANGGWSAGTEGGTIYWSAGSGAHRLSGPIADKHYQMGGPGGIAGYPTTDVLAVGSGLYAQFTNAVEIYYSQTTGAHWISGALRDTLRASGGVAGSLGFPTSDQTGTYGRNGLYVTFGPSKIILWGPSTGAYVVQDKWLVKLRNDGDVQYYGLPQSPVSTIGAYQFQEFQDASIFDGNGRTTLTIGWDFRWGWWQLGGLNGTLGMATGDVYVVSDRVFGQNFDRGYIICDYNELQCYYDTWSTALASDSNAKVSLNTARTEGTKLRSVTAKAPKK